MPRSLIGVLARRYGPRVTMEQRRLFLQATLAAGAGLLLSSRPASAMGRLGRDSRKRVVVIGAGFAGLACAHELKAAGYDVTVLESRGRVGGRVLSFNAAMGSEYVPGRNVEGGAELVGSNHPTWVQYKELFKLEFLDVTHDEGEVQYPIVIGGQRLDNDRAGALWEEMEKALNGMDALAKDVPEDEPWNAPRAAELDGTSIAQWIERQEVEPLVKAAMRINQVSDNGVDPERASLLGQLTAVKGGGLERFWSETEVYRCKGGNQLLAERLAAGLGEGRVILKLAARSIRRQGEVVIVEASDGRTIECDDVVYTAPPPTWNRVEFSPGLPAAMKPQMGLNTKHLVHLKERFWLKGESKSSQYALAEGILGMTWEGTDGQIEGIPGEGPACMVGFAGGSAVAKAMSLPKEEREAAFAELYEKWYPGFKDHVVATRYMDWPRDEWAGAAYAFPAPGEVTTVGPLLARPHLGGRLHLAGEHTSYKFVGYMEGGLNSGAAVARRLAARDGVITEVKPERKAEPVAK